MARRILIVLLVLVQSLSLAAASPDGYIYKKYSGKDGYATVLVDGRMVKKAAAAGIRELTVITPADASGRPELESDVRNYISSKSLPLLGQTRDSGKNDEIYFHESVSGSDESELIILSLEDGEFSVIRITGHFSLEDVSSISSAGGK